jgi:hypothetical protein
MNNASSQKGYSHRLPELTRMIAQAMIDNDRFTESG